jgi:VWFA-related protein
MNAARNLFRLSFCILLALPLSASQEYQFKRGQAVCVVAVQGGYIFECRPALSAKLPANPLFSRDPELFSSVQPPYPGGIPDEGLKQRVEKEFQKRNYYKLVPSAESADLVYLVAAVQRARVVAFGSGRGNLIYPGDEPPNFLEGAVAIAVPSGEFRRYLADSTALLKAAVWRGSVRSTMGNTNEVQAKPEQLVGLFHAKARMPAEWTLCAMPQPPRARAPRDLFLPAPPAPPPAASAAPSLSGGTTFKVDVELVSVPAIVTDKEGKRVPGLGEADFRMFEDDVEQKIDRILPESEPCNVALMLDVSASMFSDFREIKKAAGIFLELLRPQDRAMAISFGTNVFLNSDWTADRNQLREAIVRMRVSSSSRLYDALELALTERLEWMTGRKAIVLLTDGMDVGSGLAGPEAVRARTAAANVPVYVIQYDTRQANSHMLPSGWDIRAIPEGYRDKGAIYANATRFLQSLCSGSGGRLESAAGAGNLEEAFSRIGEELRTQYTLCYYPANPKRDGAVRRIRVEVKHPDLTVRARTEYRITAKTPEAR